MRLPSAFLMMVPEIGDRPALREAVLPDYPPFGTRILLDNGWYRTLIRDDVRLVTDPIVSVGPDRAGSR